ncbi:MAG: DUF2085 domain-containing protein [Methanobacteriota archaeon]
MGLKRDAIDGIAGLPRYMASNKAQTVFFALLLAWALAAIIAPLALPHATVDFGADGVVGGSEHAGAIGEMENPAVRLLYQAGDLNCHQIDERSYFLNGNQMPFCARCTAIFIGMPLGMAAFFVLRREFNPLLLLLAFVPIGVDGLTQAFTSYESTNLMRVITGSIAGIAAGYALAYMVREMGAIVRARPRRQP